MGHFNVYNFPVKFENFQLIKEVYMMFKQA